MKTSKYIIISLIILLSFFSACVFAKEFSFNTSTLSFTNDKKSSVSSNFDNRNNLTTSVSSGDSKLDKEIEDLTKKTTYLLLGDMNQKEETSEDYYKRYQDWLDLMYQPKIPEDKNSSDGYDHNSQEYKDSLISGMAMPQIFSQIQESDIKYNSYGNIRILKNNDLIISSIVIPNITRKVENKEEPMKYEEEETNLIMYYYYKKNKEHYQIYYLYGEIEKDISSYFNEMANSENKGQMAIAPSYDSELKKIYNFDKLDKMTDTELNTIYENNKRNVLFLNSYYNNKVIASANGFFINNGFVVTTWNFIEKSLINGQYISIKDNDFNAYELDGIVTANPETDIAVLKIKQAENSYVKIGNYKQAKVEDPVITISSKTGAGLLSQTGIILSLDGYIQSSIPLTESDQGSPLFNQSGEVIGINTTKLVNSSTSLSINSDVLKEIQSKFTKNNFNSVKSVSFKDLKEKYYYVKYNEEKIKKEIPKKKWNEYSKIGNVKNTITLKLVKSNYKGDIISLRYKNNISDYISSMQLSINFINQLKADGFKEAVVSDNKKIYTNKKYKVVIMEELNYLIILMEKI